ncbi:transposase [Rhizobium sp. BK376]|uniref:P-loop ATPase, Sll1717 family n=1 Tax=Rhizobium sp. BK376 TaxID=2512149 RepID=UPI00104AA4D0|nr:transposase [Rhizobium sp. BK376]TCR91050.1 hypothetical protein EV561_103447 [Rhizobium sp. BK376]
MKEIQLPRDALQRVDLGKAFAEYDIIRRSAELFVSTPATLAALNKSNNSCFFIGRRGSGKTAITIEMERKSPRTVTILPQIFDLIKLPLDVADFKDTRQRPFKSLVYAVERALLGELIKQWIKDKKFDYGSAPDVVQKERTLIENLDFEERFLNLCDEIFQAFQSDNERLWLRQIKRRDELFRAIQVYGDDANYHYTFLIDRLDESWDGSDTAIICLMALMHASVRLIASNPCIKPCVFIRENIYDRIKAVDNEFSRLETSVVFLEWTEAKLAEFVARRLVHPFNTKPKLVDAWGYFFQEDKPGDAIQRVMALSQHRPRDVLMLCDYAIKSAINENHQKIQDSDLRDAEKRYSTSRLKDLGDEYAENYPNISVIIEYFFGLGNEFTISAIEDFIQKLLLEEKINKHCSSWFYDYTVPFRFVELFYSIGFLGLRGKRGVVYKDTGADANTKPLIDHATTFVVHPTYSAALNLRPIVLSNLSEETILQHEGILEDLPDSFGLDEYKETLKKTLEDLKTLPVGSEGATRFEDIVGTVIKLCFFRYLTNVQAKERTYDSSVIRDWIASNRAPSGFWEMIRQKHGATQVVWECKNYEDLHSDDFHQVQYYLNKTSGYFGIIAYRGDKIKDSYFKHISAIANKNDNGIVMPITQKDLEVFLRQAIKGTSKENHIQDRYDNIIRMIS